MIDILTAVVVFVGFIALAATAGLLWTFSDFMSEYAHPGAADVAMALHTIQALYAVAPNKWTLYENCAVYSDGSAEFIYLKNPIEYIKYRIWKHKLENNFDEGVRANKTKDLVEKWKKDISNFEEKHL